MQKTIHINLSKHASASKLAALNTALGFIDAIVSEYLAQKKQELETKKYANQNETYAIFRKKYPTLDSGVLQSTTRFVDECIKSYTAICKKKHKLVTFPESISVPLILRAPTIKLSSKSKHFEYWIHIWKRKYPIKLNTYTEKIIAKAEKFNGSRIMRDKCGNLILHLVCELKSTKSAPHGTHGIGIDVGIAAPIVCSDNARFGSGGYIKHRKIEFGKQRARHQANKQQISNKQSNWTKDLNHKLSKQCVDYAVSQGITVLGIEKLRGQELSNRRFRKYNWAFRQLLNFIKYKAEAAGISVVGVNPKYTSQTCAQCGSQSKDNRQSQSKFVCIACGHRANADLNAARNILLFSLENGLQMTEPAVSRAVALSNCETGRSIASRWIECHTAVVGGSSPPAPTIPLHVTSTYR